MKKIIFILMLLIGFQINAQESKTKIIYVLGGIASTYTKDDIEFEKIYNIKYHDFGCVVPINFEEYEAKNKIVFDYLKKTFGLNWIQKIKTSAMGLEKWKKT